MCQIRQGRLWGCVSTHLPPEHNCRAKRRPKIQGIGKYAVLKTEGTRRMENTKPHGQRTPKKARRDGVVSPKPLPNCSPIGAIIAPCHTPMPAAGFIRVGALCQLPRSPVASGHQNERIHGSVEKNSRILCPMYSRKALVHRQDNTGRGSRSELTSTEGACSRSRQLFLYMVN